MICPKCKGERAVYRKVGNTITLTPCPMCNGVGEVVVTNFDRITASPEALAEYLVGNGTLSPCGFDMICEDNCPLYERCGTDKFPSDYEVFLMWLNKESKE